MYEEIKKQIDLLYEEMSPFLIKDNLSEDEKKKGKDLQRKIYELEQQIPVSGRIVDLTQAIEFLKSEKNLSQESKDITVCILENSLLELESQNKS